MSENLKRIDQDLIELEDRLLAELRRLRKLDSAEVYSHIDPALHEGLKLNYGALLESLQATGDWSNLSLKSEEQEWIEDRMRIVRNLLVRKLPTAFLSASHQEHKATSSSEFGTDAHYASELLVILDEQVARHQVDGRTIEQVMQERAEFNSKELSKGHAQDSRRQIAQSPDEIRNKLKGSTGSGGPSRFESRDLGGSTSRSAIPQKPASTGNAGIAQSPEDIRKKLQGSKGSGGPSTFTSRDLGGSTPEAAAPRKPAPEPEKSRIAQSPEEIRHKLAERQTSSTGKAVFGSRDIEPIPDKFPAATKKKEEPPKPRTGPAVFESKDLSD